jgi:drug/metabolite transporter (DMT)-like permease
MWGFTGILGKLIHLDAYIIVWHRLLIAVLGLFTVLLLLKKSVLPLHKSHFWKSLGVGVVVALHWMTFYKSIELSTASLGILCLSTATLHVTWLGPLITKQRFSWVEFLMGLIVIYGIYFVSADFNSNDFIALQYGLFSAFFAALFSVLNARLSKDIEPYKMSLYELFSAFVFLSIFLIFSGKMSLEIFKMTLSDFFWLLFLGLLCTSFAFLASIEVVKRLGAFTFSLSVNLEPVYTIVLAIVILHEDELLNRNFYFGSILIVLVVIANAFYKSRFNKENASVD